MLTNSSQMRLPSPGSVVITPEGERRNLNSELWHACAGPLVSLPAVGSRVVYLPQGHSEQVAASTQREVDAQIPAYPNLPPQLVCQLHDVILHADLETDEVYCQMTLQPVTPDSYFVPDPGTPNRQPNIFFCKTLTASDTSTHGGFSIPRRAAEKVFPSLDYNQQPPAQELVARDLHDNEWKFRHIYRGQPKRHLLTTGWSVFVSTKRLIAGDSVLFIRNDKGQLLLGIRRATRPQTVLPSSVLSSDSMHIGVLAAAAHASNTNSRFTVFYNPRASPSEFVIPFSKFEKAVYQSRVSVGMRFRMLFETEESTVRRYMGTITGIGDLDPVRWPNSQWRSIKVGWDESTAGERQRRVSLWEIEPLTTFLVYPPTSNWRLRNPWSQPLIGAPFMHEMDFESSKKPSTWMQFQNGASGYAGLATHGAAAAMNPLLGSMQWRFDTSIESDVYDSLGAAALQEISPSKQLQFQQPKPQADQLLYRSQAQMQLQTPYLYPALPRQLQPQPAQAQILPQGLAPPQPLLLPANPQMPLQSHQQQPPHLQLPNQPHLQQSNQPPVPQSSQLQEQPHQRQHQQLQASTQVQQLQAPTQVPHLQQQEQHQQPPQQQVLLQHQQQAQQLPQLQQQQQQQQVQHPPQAQQQQQHQQQLHPQPQLQPQLQPKQEQYHHQYQKQLQPQQQQHPQQQQQQHQLQHPQNQQQQQRQHHHEQQQPHQQQPPPQTLPPLQQQQRHVQTHLPHYPSAVPTPATVSLTSPSVPLRHNSPLLQPTQQQGSISSHLSTQQQQQGYLHYPVVQQPQVQLSSPGQLHQLPSFTPAPTLVNGAARLPSLQAQTTLPSPQVQTVLPSPQSALLEANGMLNSTVAPNTLQTILNHFVADTNAPPPNPMSTSLPSVQPSTLVSGSELQSDCSVPASWVSTLNPLSSGVATELIEATRPLGELCVGSNTDAVVMPSFSASGLPSNSCAYREFSQEQDELPLDLYRQAQFGANIDLQAMVLPSSMPPPDSRSYSGSNELQCMSPFLQGQSSMMGMDVSANGGLFSGGLDDPRLLQAWAQSNTPVRTYTKVYKSGSVGRSLDVMRFSNYPELRHELAKMFGLEGQLEDPISGWQLIFVDRENDWLLLGDDPWEVFINNVRSIRILSPSEVFQMQDGVGLQTSYSIQRQTSCSSEDGTTQQESRNPSSVITSTCSLEY